MTIKKNNFNGVMSYDVYVCVYSKLINGLRKQMRKTGVKSHAKAKRLEREMYSECAKALSLEENRDMEWSELVYKWHDFEKNKKVSPLDQVTLKDYLGTLKKWTLPFWSKSVCSINKHDIRRVIEQMELDCKALGHQKKTKRVINKVFQWGIDEEVVKNLQTSPVVGVKLRKAIERPPEILTTEEVDKFLKLAKGLNHEWYSIWACAVLTGCRNGELHALTWDDIDFERNLIRVSKSYNQKAKIVKSTKAGYWRNIPMNSNLKSLLLEVLKTNNGRKEVLPRIKDWDKGYQAKVLRTFLISIGLPSVKFHALRACFATMLLQRSVAPAIVMKICGWKDLDTMARYIRMAGIDEKGATDCLNILPNGSLDNIVNLY